MAAGADEAPGAGEQRFVATQSAAGFLYGDLVYVDGLGVLAELEREGHERRFRTPPRLPLEGSAVAARPDPCGDSAGGESATAAAAPKAPVFAGFDELRLVAQPPPGEPAGGREAEQAHERSWYWLSLRYGVGDEEVSLAEVLEARHKGLAYLPLAGGFLDVRGAAWRHVDELAAAAQEQGGDATGGALRLSALQVLRLAASAAATRVEDEVEPAAGAALRALLELRPPPAFDGGGLASPLRPYQRLGAKWLAFLWENRLGGLLCDDMGLGKTHQAMELLAWLAGGAAAEAPSLVICPRTVLSHWRARLAAQAPQLAVASFHGADRDLAAAREANVVLTSYGVLRRSAAELAAAPWAAVLLDEAQNLKNPQTDAHRAAAALLARSKVGLTGTPVENRLEDLVALVDLVLPGYLSRGDRQSLQGNLFGAEQRAAAERLRRVTRPFLLRRVKAEVLAELPEKIEDVRTCALSEQQVKLYREAVEGRGAALRREVVAGSGPLPYLHVFALLNLLKRICDHPALALDELDEAGRYSSGKWDLFQELLEECLDSGHKVVVFSQYLGMLTLMERLLGEWGVGHVTLTGASRGRGELIARFNEDPACRVFLGSLKAGGTGIDLVGGSVVIHYDRWWNAAREDQATDRVHRIGQRRAVQVLKLVTEGTLEEKIHAIIEAKAELASQAVEVDSPELRKLFTRAEILALLAPPTAPRHELGSLRAYGPRDDETLPAEPG